MEPHLQISPVAINLLSLRSTATAADLKMPPIGDALTAEPGLLFGSQSSCAGWAGQLAVHGESLSYYVE